MPEIKLKIDDLVLDHDNPRITHAEGQQEALQKIVKDQKAKLVKLAESIVKHGMSRYLEEFTFRAEPGSLPAISVRRLEDD